MKIAFVYDKVTKFGGAERILLSLKEIWKDAPLYTAVYNKATAKWADEFKVKQSFVRHFPVLSKFQELSILASPFAFESFSFKDFDLVISICSQDSKSIITDPGTLHICYCLTPTRYLWSGYQEYYREPGTNWFNPVMRTGMKLLFPRLREWDLITSKRPDYYISISKTVKKRISKYYSSDSEIVYPPVNTDLFVVSEKKPLANYFLIVSRLVPYKRLDYAVKAFNKLKYPLKIIGTGVDGKRLKKLAGDNIEFIEGYLTDRKLCWYYQNCIALIFPGEEDFGLTPLEAQACGRPVIALNIGGATESILNLKTGILYSQKTEQGLIGAIKKFNKYSFNPVDCRNNSLKFSKEVFNKKIKDLIEVYFSRYKKSL